VNKTVKTATKITEELSQLNENSDVQQDVIQHTKARLGEFLKKKCKNKAMHGQCIISRDRQLVSEKNTFLWLSRGQLKQKLKVKWWQHKTEH
jgi:hypothetical protein